MNPRVVTEISVEKNKHESHFTPKRYVYIVHVQKKRQAILY